MLNNGHGGIGTPDGGHQGGHPMYSGGGGGHPGGGGPVEYASNNPHSYLGPSPPSSMNNGIGGGHHSGGYCSQMTLNQNNQCPPNTKQCGGCHQPILERYLLHVLDRFWHHNCLKCHICGSTLADVGVSCFTRDSMILCRQDYSRMFGVGGGACHGCGKRIPPTELVMRAGVSQPGSYGPYVYHIPCFQCSKCMCTLQSGDRYSVLNGALFCEQDALKFMKNGIGSPSNANVATSNGPAPPRKGKVGRPRRSRD